MIKTLQGVKPQIGIGTFVATTAAVIGDVVLGEGCSVWYSAVIRGDVNKIRIGNRVSIQDGCCLHTSGGEAFIGIGSNVTVGHNATLHGCKIGDGVLIGMGATVLDNAVIDSGSIVAAGALVLGKTHIPSGELWGGVPAKFIKKLTPEMTQRIVNEGLSSYDYWTKVYLGEEDVSSEKH
ncbi:MAG: gamma carbonic anhydrase family protein [Prevotella sp.]|nr:gamma carbonic anhydrase family protein [Prevotella sp.]